MRELLYTALLAPVPHPSPIILVRTVHEILEVHIVGCEAESVVHETHHEVGLVEKGRELVAHVVQ